MIGLVDGLKPRPTVTRQFNGRHVELGVVSRNDLLAVHEHFLELRNRPAHGVIQRIGRPTVNDAALDLEIAVAAEQQIAHPLTLLSLFPDSTEKHRGCESDISVKPLISRDLVRFESDVTERLAA